MQNGCTHSESFRGVPTNALGEQYLALTDNGDGGTSAGQFTLVSTQDNTTVTITPTASLNKHPAGVPFTITLNAGEVYNHGSDGNDEVTGSSITANEPIAVYGSNPYAELPSNVGFVNPLLEELPPVQAWGREYVVAPFAVRTAPDLYRILASADGTQVSVNGTVVAVLNRGQFIDEYLTTAADITATAPILVGQFSLGAQVDNSPVGDPSFLIDPAVEQYRASYTVVNIDKPTFTSQFLNLTVPTSGIAGVIVDGVAVPGTDFQSIAGSIYSFAQVPVTTGLHTVAASVPFGLTVYGMGLDDMNSFPGGGTLAPINAIASLALTPKTASGLVGVAAPLTATVLDSSGNPVAGVHVDFTVTGANPSSGFAYTDATGVAQFADTGAVVGINPARKNRK